MSSSNQNNNPDYRNTKIFVGNLAWKTKTDALRKFFQQFGEILDANVVCESYPGKSKGYGFVIFKDAEFAARVCKNKCYVIDGREANINLAYLGVKNNTNQSIQNGSLNQTGLLHQHHPTPQYINGHFHSPLFYWNPYYRQFFFHISYPTPMIYYSYGSTYVTQHVNTRPVRRRRHNQLVTADVVHPENHDETVTTPDTDLGQQVAEDQEGASIREDNAINQLDSVIEVTFDDRVQIITEETLHENKVVHGEHGEDTPQENRINQDEGDMN